MILLKNILLSTELSFLKSFHAMILIYFEKTTSDYTFTEEL